MSLPPRILCVDVETTGLISERHSILQIGAVWLTGEPGEFALDCRAWDGAELDPKALEINGCSPERCFDHDYPSETDAVMTFARWTGLLLDAGPQPVMLAGMTPSYDRGFIHSALRRAGRRGLLFPHRVIDLHTLAVQYAMSQCKPVPPRGYYTDEIYALLDLPAEPRPHVALTGARRQAEALHKLLYLGQQ